MQMKEKKGERVRTSNVTTSKLQVFKKKFRRSKY